MNNPEIPPINIDIKANLIILVLFICFTPLPSYLLSSPKQKNNAYKHNGFKTNIIPILVLLKYIFAYDIIKKRRE